MKSDLNERFLNISAEVIKEFNKGRVSYAARYISTQLIRSVTSSGANYEEACGAESKADFIHKMQIVLKELRETLYWLKLINKAELIKNFDAGLVREIDELSKITAKSIVTARRIK